MEKLLGKAEAAAETPYQTYGGQRIAGPTAEQQAVRQNVAGMGNVGQYDVASQMAGVAGMGAASAMGTQYSPSTMQQFYQGPQFQGMGIDYLSTQAPQLQQYQMGPTPMARAAQTGAAAPVYGPQLQQYAMGPAERAMTGSFAQPGAAEAYMSPYMQNVVDVQTREAQRQADIAKTQRGAKAVGAGAFGGSRQAIEEAEAARNLATQKGDIQAQGLQSAYQQAQQAYQTDAQRQLQTQLANQQAGLTVGGQNLGAALQTQGLGAQTGMQAQLANQQAQQQALMANQQARQQVGLANQQAGLTTQQQNLAAMLGVQQLGAQTGMQSQQLNQAAQLQAQQQALGQNEFANRFAQQNAQLAAQYGLSGQELAERSRQFGADLGLRGLTTGIQGATQAAATMGQLGGAQQQSALDLAKAQEAFGSFGQQQSQQQMDLAYQDFLNQQRYPYTQMGFMSDILRGSGNLAGTGGYAMYQQPPSQMQQMVGPGLLGLGMYREFLK
jgi:hypothetical protein